MADDIYSTRESIMPTWAQPYSLRLLGQGENLAYNTPYVSYEGARVAGLDPLQEQAYAGLKGLTTPDQISKATEMLGLAGLDAGKTQQFDAGMMQQYMSPYMQGVVEQQKRGAIQDYGRSLPGLGTTELRSGAYGGTRGALMRSEANRNLQNQLQGIQATGLQNAFTNAQQQFNTEQQARMRGIDQRIAAAGSLGNIGETEFSQRLRALQNQAQMGEEARKLRQQELDAKYSDWTARQNYPYKQLNFMSNLIGSTPSSSTVESQPGGDLLSQLIGSGIGIAGLFKLLQGGG